MSFGRKYRMPPWVLAVGMALIFFGVVGYAKWSGSWHSDIPDVVYEQLIPQLDTDAAVDYASLLRAHIAKENDILFVMAEQLLSEAEQTRMVEAFEDVELNKLGAGTHDRLHGLMDRIYAEIFGK